MLDPANISCFDGDDDHLQEQMLFWMAVAGKTAKTVAPKINRLVENLAEYSWGRTPFEVLRPMTDAMIRMELAAVKLGKYDLLTRGVREVVKLNLRTCTVDELEAVPGIGPKTARCFLLHTRAGVRHAGLDTHLMKFLREVGETDKAGTPANPEEYARLEAAVLFYADGMGMTPAEFDLMVWNHYTKR